MHDILSQEEIDLLIKAATAPETDEDDYLEEGQDVLYDFSNPTNSPKSRYGAPEIHEQFSCTYAGLMSANSAID